MGLDALWQQCADAGYQVWVWVRYESGIHPLLFLGVVIVIISAVIMYKAEVRRK
jgi:hypothetical protein